MAKKQQQQRVRVRTTAYDDRLGNRLREHFASEEADARLRSSHGPLVDMALSGAYGASGGRQPDAHITDRWRVRQGEHRKVHAALATLTPRQRQVLWLAYGPHVWHPQVYARLSALGACCGVVLLGEGARASHATAAATGKTRMRDVGEWLRGTAPAADVRAAITEGEALLRDARGAFLGALKGTAKRAPRVYVATLPRVEPLVLRPRMELA